MYDENSKSDSVFFNRVDTGAIGMVGRCKLKPALNAPGFSA
jgi:hypothetical protein